MSWIKTIDFESADSRLKKIYKKVAGPNNHIDNILMIHSLRPHTLVGHMTLYKNVLHNSNNKLPKWYLESIGVYVSYLNNCEYCFEHHLAGFSRLINDDIQAEKFKMAIINNDLKNYFDKKYFKGCDYAKKLTLHHNDIKKKDIEDLRQVGFSDGEILEINQVASYFNYVNRIVVGLGVDTQGDILGLSPNNNDDPDHWNHD